MASEFAKNKSGFRLNFVEIMAVLSFLFMMVSLILSVTTENPGEFVVDSVKNVINNNGNQNNEPDAETPQFNFSNGGGGASTPKIIFAAEDSGAYKKGMQELVDQGLLPSIPTSGDNSYFYFEDLERNEKVFIARLDTKGEEENCITSNEYYSCIFYDFEELVVFYENDKDEKEVVFDNRENR